MKIGIISDVHSNFFALKKAVEFLLEKEKIDTLICAGDFVGYGPQPKECIDFIKNLKIQRYSVLGNHDLGVRYYYSGGNNKKSRKMDKSFLKEFEFNERAEKMLKHNAESIDLSHYNFLNSLTHKKVFKIDEGNLTRNCYLVHGSPSKRRNSRIGKYLMGLQSFDNITKVFTKDKETKLADIIITGHTHRRFITVVERKKYTKILNWSLLKEKIGDKKDFQFPIEFKIEHKKKKNKKSVNHQMIINPGSVGQSRDGTGNISFVTLDITEEFDTIKFYDLDYKREKFYDLTKEFPEEVRGAEFWQRIF